MEGRIRAGPENTWKSGSGGGGGISGGVGGMSSELGRGLIG